MVEVRKFTICTRNFYRPFIYNPFIDQHSGDSSNFFVEFYDLLSIIAIAECQAVLSYVLLIIFLKKKI